MKVPRDQVRLEKRQQLLAIAKVVASLGEHREIEAIPAAQVTRDVELRYVLETVVRRWSRLTPITYTTRAAAARGAPTHIEHVVPVRVLVDRMLMRPRRVRFVLENCVVLGRVTRREHRRLGGIYVHHQDLYRKMLACRLEDLPSLGLRRYRNVGIELTQAPNIR